MIKINKERFNSFIYILVICLYTSLRIISSSYIIDIIPFSINDFISNFCIVALIFTILMSDKINIKRFALIVLLTIMFGIITYVVRDRGVLITYLVLITFSTKIDINYLARVQYKLMFITCAIIVIFSLLGIINNYSFFQHGTIRYSMGFMSPNSFANWVTLSVLLFTFSRKDKIKIFELFTLFLLVFFIYLITNSRLAFYIAIFNIFISFLLMKNKGKFLKKIILSTGKNIFSTLSIICIGVTIYFSKKTSFSSFYNIINELFTGRLQWMIQYYNNYGIHAIGQKIATVSKKEAIQNGLQWSNIDNSYIYIAIKYGSILLLIICLMYYLLGSLNKKNKDIYSALYIICICLIGITENFFLMSGYNFSLIMVAKMLKFRKGEE